MSAARLEVSAILLTYNCVDFAAAALESVLSQDCEPMEILVSDDASSDGTFEVIRREVENYSGSHRVRVRRRGSTSGSKSAHLNEVIPMTSGHVLVSFDGDDVSVPGRVRTLTDAFLRNPEVQAVYSGYSLIDEKGRHRGSGRVPHPDPGSTPARWFARVDAFAAGATLALRREVVDVFGPLDPRIHEDVVLPFRASLMGDVSFIDEDLVKVRRWGGSLTADRARFQSLAGYRTWMLTGIDKARRQFRSRLADFDTAERLMLPRAPDLEGLRRVARDSLAEAEASAGLVDPSPWTRWRCFLRLWRSGSSAYEILQNAALAFFPRLYLFYKRKTLGTGSEPGPL